ncbi:MAG: HTH domain-containing protein [Halosimplex sp.]
MQEPPADADARDRYVTCSEWARERGLSLRPAFGTRECYAMDTGERGEWVVFPALTLAVYEGGDLAAVYPHADGERYRSVGDGLDALAGADGDDTVGDRAPAPITTAD